MAALSLLGITSHHQKHHSHNSLSVHHSAVVSRHTPSLPEQRLLTFSHGTRVSIRDLFGSMPVRAKQRPSSGDRGAIEKEWRRLLRDMVGLILPWRNPVSVYMREANAGLELRFRPPRQKPGSTPGIQNLISRVSRTLIQANLADTEDAESWEKVGGSGADMSVTGCVSLNPVASRRSQFICLGIQPIPNDAGSNVLYEEVNRIFSNSVFALEDEDKAQGSRRGIFGQKLKKGVERWPMFYFRIDVKDRTEGGRYSLDQLLDQGHRVEGVIDLLKAVCYEFLRKHHFKPQASHVSVDRRQPQGSCEGTPSRLSMAPTRPKKSASRAPSPFDMWSRVKAGKPVHAAKPGSPAVTPRLASRADLGDERSDEGPQRPTSRQPLLGRDGKLLRAPFPDALEPGETEGSKPRSREKRPRGSSRTRSTSEIPRNQEPRAVSLAGTTPGPSQRSEPSPWLADLLQNWKNPVFAPAQPPIPTTHDSTRGTHSLPETPSIPLQSHISRPALQNASVISQVDKKFILARLPRPSGPLLVLIDQHAADERCRLEELMRGYFSGGRAESEPLAELLRFEVPGREAALLACFRGYFARWGVCYSASDKDVTVFALPPSILERCRQEPRLLISLLRSEAWKLEERGVSGGEREFAGDDWVRRFHGCPAGILDLLNSRACRSELPYPLIPTFRSFHVAFPQPHCQLYLLSPAFVLP